MNGRESTFAIPRLARDVLRWTKWETGEGEIWKHHTGRSSLCWSAPSGAQYFKAGQRPAYKDTKA